jgi:hypothetical protein
LNSKQNAAFSAAGRMPFFAVLFSPAHLLWQQLAKTPFRLHQSGDA